MEKADGDRPINSRSAFDFPNESPPMWERAADVRGEWKQTTRLFFVSNSTIFPRSETNFSFFFYFPIKE